MSKKIIGRREIIWLTKHHMDPLGSTFLYNDRIFTVVNPGKEDFFKTRIVNLCHELSKEGFAMDVDICDEFVIEGYEEHLIFERKRVPYLTIVEEWTYEMFLDAARMICALQAFLRQRGWQLLDPHNQNVAFCGTRPVYLDIGSFALIENGNEKMGNEFVLNHWLKPLALYKYTDIDWKTIVTSLSFGRIFVSKLLEKENGLLIDFEEVLQNGDTSVRHSTANSEWGKYSDSQFDRSGKVVEERFEFYIDLIKELKASGEQINSMLDIGGNSGVLDELLVDEGIIENACIIDYCEDAISNGYRRIGRKTSCEEKITFCCSPFFNDYDLTRIKREQRFKSDIVFACALTHHLLLSQRLERRTIGELLASYSRKYVVVEFMPLGMWAEGCVPSPPSWYTYDWFVAGISEYLEVLWKKQIDTNRVCCFCKKKNS